MLVFSLGPLAEAQLCFLICVGFKLIFFSFLKFYKLMQIPKVLSGPMVERFFCHPLQKVVVTVR